MVVVAAMVVVGAGGALAAQQAGENDGASQPSGDPASAYAQIPTDAFPTDEFPTDEFPTDQLPTDQLPTDEAQTDRAQALMRQFACVVCAGQSIAQSDAEPARRMRAVVMQGVGEGLSDRQIRDRIARQYGDAALLDPPAKGAGLVLWLVPLALLLGGAVFAWRCVRANGVTHRPDGVSEPPTG